MNRIRNIINSFEQCRFNHLCNNTDLFMKHLESLTETSMHKALTDQHEAVTLYNAQKLF